MSDAIIVALITAGIPTIATAITATVQARESTKNAAKQSILQMMLEDRMAVQEGHLPTNYQNVLHEFDVYTQNGGNSYVHDKVEEYKDWFAEVEKSHKLC